MADKMMNFVDIDPELDTNGDGDDEYYEEEEGVQEQPASLFTSS